MVILNGEDISVSYGGQMVLDKVSLAVNEGERVGIVGVNGAGKTTLLKCLTKELIPDSGNIHLSTAITYQYLEQLANYQEESSIWELVLDSFANLLELRSRLRELELVISSAREEDLPKLMTSYALVTEEYEKNDGYLCESNAKKVLMGLGFKDSDFARKVKSLSGGERTRLNLARLLALKPELLFLDEPTNHLDLEAVEWLEDFLVNYKGTIILVSHDRLFLDQVVTRLVEVSHNKLYAYPGNYTNYLKLKAANSQAWAKAYQKQQVYINKTRQYIDKYRAGIKSKQAQGREKQLARLELIENIAAEKTIDIGDYKMQETSATDVLFVENLSKSYDKLLFAGVNIHIRKGEKVAIIGPNGCGKTTLLKIIVGQVSADKGEIRIGNRVIIGYFSQEMADLEAEKIVLEEIIYNFDITIEKARTLLGSMLFSEDEVFKRVKNLSGGEKARLSILKLLLTGANFLILDEPTNHLDIDSRLVIEDILATYPGTILLVSHDRFFIDQIARQLLVFNNNSLTKFLGNYSDFYQQGLNEAKAEVTKEKLAPSNQQLLRQEQKEEERIERRLRREIALLEDEISLMETKMLKIEKDLANPNIYADVAKVQVLGQELDEIENVLQDLYEKWNELMDYADDKQISL